MARQQARFPSPTPPPQSGGGAIHARDAHGRHPISHLFDQLFGDRGYISQALVEHLFTTQVLRLITNVRKNMRERLLPYVDKLLLRKRAILKHSRHRSPYNFLVHLLAGWVAYCHQPKKPSLHLDHGLDRLV